MYLLKLVRDRVGQKFEGYVVTFRPIDKLHVSDEELAWKVVEEAQEFVRGGSLEELADVYEAVVSNAERAGWTLDDLRRKVNSKRLENGGFDNSVGMYLVNPEEVNS